MNTRSKVKRSLPTLPASERLVTKKEMEEEPMRFKTCPPITKKAHLMSQYLKENMYCVSEGCAKPVYFNCPTSLSRFYRPCRMATYLCQLYNVYECIGEGSFGVVYKARNMEEDKLYAIKLMKRCAFTGLKYSEVKRVEKIGEHENLVKFYMAWEENSVVHMQLELCALSLTIYTKTNHKLANAQLWDIFIDMLHALKHLHDRALVHLDIKPDNIMMSKDGKYKLGDFGLLMDLNEAGPSVSHGAESSEGDAKYLAKEVLEGTYTAAADIFSLGISMLELASDIILPGNGPLWHIFRDGSFASDYFQLVPSRLRRVITKMMLPDVEHRITVDGIFQIQGVKRAIEERRNKSRTNYYDIWRAQNADENEPQPILVCLNARNTPPRVVGDESDDEDMGVEPLRNTSACVTPPKCVSQVILYSI